MGVLPLKNPNWFLGDEMLLLAPATSEFLQTVVYQMNTLVQEPSRDLFQALSEKKRLVYVVNRKESMGLNSNKNFF